jgi:predicted GNAT family acetyltransferase
MKTSVHDNRVAQRFEMDLGGKTAFVSYRRKDQILTLLHIEVPAEFQGRGLGTQLAHDVLELVRAEGARVVALCPFIRIYIARHAEFRDLLAASR